MMFTILKPVVLTVQPSQLTEDMPALFGYVIFLTDEDKMTTPYRVAPNKTALSLDDPMKLRVGKHYTVTVLSINDIGDSDEIKSYFGK